MDDRLCGSQVSDLADSVARPEHAPIHVGLSNVGDVALSNFLEIFLNVVFANCPLICEFSDDGAADVFLGPERAANVVIDATLDRVVTWRAYEFCFCSVCFRRFGCCRERGTNRDSPCPERESGVQARFIVYGSGRDQWDLREGGRDFW